MRLNRGVRTLAAVVSLAAVTAPAAYANDIGEGGSGLSPALQAQVATSHRSAGSTDWPLIALGAGGAVLVGAGVGGSRAHSRRRSSASDLEPARLA
jgi:hypothetical protein